MYNENHNNIYHNNNISNKNQLDLSLSNVKPDDRWLECLKRKKINTRKTSVTCWWQEKNINKGPKKYLEFSMYFIEEFSNMQLFLRLYLVLP